MKRVLLSFFTVFLSLGAVAQMNDQELKNFIQTASEKQLLTQHSTFLIEGFLFNADLIADRLLEMKPENGNYLYRKGYTLMEVHKDYDRAIELFTKASVNVSNNYDMFSTKETHAPADVFFHLGAAYHCNEDIEKAVTAYQSFLDLTKKKSELKSVAELRLLQCEQAKLWMATPSDVVLANVGPEINTAAPEFSPVISLDGSALYFTSRRLWENGEANGDRDHIRRLPPEDVFVSYMDFESNWTEPARLRFCLPNRNEATCAVSMDERRILLYLDSTGGGDIYYTDFYAASFTDIELLDSKKINTEYWETHCMISQDNQHMFFVSNRPGGYGGRDIYYCTRIDDEWSDPVNMGPNINSPFDEDAPFVSIDNQTLYYSTNGQKSIGGFDVMKSQWENGAWSEGENLGYPFNSTSDDIFYTTTVDGMKGYMTSNRKNGFGEKDIYEIKNNYLGVQNMVVLQGTIKSVDGLPLKTNTVIQVKLTCTDCERQTETKVYPRARDGFYLSGLEPCKKYRMDYQNISDSLTIYTDYFNTPCDSGYLEITKGILLNPDYTIHMPEVADTLPTDLDSVEQLAQEFPDLEFKAFLGYNKNKLSFKEGELADFLKKIDQQMKEGRERITIEIYASASKVPTQSFQSNELLAKKRAENIRSGLTSYFSQSQYKEQIEFEIREAVVQGPDYGNDPSNEEKYGKFQYVQLKTK